MIYQIGNFNNDNVSTLSGLPGYAGSGRSRRDSNLTEDEQNPEENKYDFSEWIAYNRYNLSKYVD